MRSSVLTPFLLSSALFAFAACGSDESSSSSSSSSASGGADVALREVGETRDALTQALATYKSGDKTAAEEQVSEAYLQHFEEVEGPLEARDKELMERIEHGIKDELRADMKSAKPAAEVESAVDALIADLDKAEAALR
jgi:high-affinity iron transporter